MMNRNFLTKRLESAVNIFFRTCYASLDSLTSIYSLTVKTSYVFQFIPVINPFFLGTHPILNLNAPTPTVIHQRRQLKNLSVFTDWSIQFTRSPK